MNGWLLTSKEPESDRSRWGSVGPWSQRAARPWPQSPSRINVPTAHIPWEIAGIVPDLCLQEVPCSEEGNVRRQVRSERPYGLQQGHRPPPATSANKTDADRTCSDTDDTMRVGPRGQGGPAVLTDSLKFCTVSKAQRSQVIKILSLQAKNSSRFMPHVGESCLAWLLPLGKRSNLASTSFKAGAHGPGFRKDKGARAPPPTPTLGEGDEAVSEQLRPNLTPLVKTCPGPDREPPPPNLRRHSGDTWMVSTILRAVSCSGNASCVTWVGHLASLNLRLLICKM